MAHGAAYTFEQQQSVAPFGVVWKGVEKMRRLSLLVVVMAVTGALLAIPGFAGQSQPAEDAPGLVAPEPKQCLPEKPAPAPTLKSLCNALAECHDGSTVSCTGVNTCDAYDHDCLSSNFEGYVECDGVRTYCLACDDCYTFGQACRYDKQCRVATSAMCMLCYCDQGFCNCP